MTATSRVRPHRFDAGQTLIERAGHVYAAFNAGDVPAGLVVTYLVPKGAPVTTLLAT